MASSLERLRQQAQEKLLYLAMLAQRTSPVTEEPISTMPELKLPPPALSVGSARQRLHALRAPGAVRARFQSPRPAPRRRSIFFAMKH